MVLTIVDLAIGKTQCLVFGIVEKVAMCDQQLKCIGH